MFQKLSWAKIFMAALNDFENHLKNDGLFPIQTSMRCLIYLATYTNFIISGSNRRVARNFTVGWGILWEASGGLEAKPPEAGDFCCFFEENTSFLGTSCCYLKGFKSFNFSRLRRLKV